MKLILSDKKVTVFPMDVPEAINNVFIEYEFAFGTNHFCPTLFIDNKRVVVGTHVHVDLSSRLKKYGDPIEIKVVLKDSKGVVKYTYEGTVPFYNYTIVGKKPIRIDLEAYIEQLEQTIKQLQEDGEVI